MKKILVVEDGPITSNVYLNRLRQAGFEAEAVDDGLLALAKLASFKPDAVLLDLMIPRLNGLEVLKKIRADAETSQLPVVVFSNAYQSRLVEQAWKSGASAVLIKANAMPKEIVAKLAQLLAASSAQPPPSPQTARQESALGQADEEFRRTIIDAFYAQSGSIVADVRVLWLQFVEAKGSSSASLPLIEMQRRLHSMTGNAAVAECLSLAQLSGALEAMVGELAHRPKYINPSSLRTVAQTLDFIEWLVTNPGALPHSVVDASVKVLVVDDDIISRGTVEAALQLVGLECVTAESAAEALKLLETHLFDLVLLDVVMPEMNGFELCERLRKIPAYKARPVVFVTGMADFQSRVQSFQAGAADLIGKPFLLIELGIKSLLHIYRSRLSS